MTNWWQLTKEETVDSPALLIYKDRVAGNIEKVKAMMDDINRLRPHVKTSKIAEVCEMMLQAGITKFKCATIAEAEMLGQINAPDVLLAYQPVGPKQERFLSLIKSYPNTVFSCLIDNESTAKELAQKAKEEGIAPCVFIDVNVGMNRTGIPAENIVPLLQKLKEIENLVVKGFHAYDGHIHDTGLQERKAKSDAAFAPVEAAAQEAENLYQQRFILVVGGTPTFPIHAMRKEIECSPGTFVFWDWGYKHLLPDEPFDYAALLLTRVISVLDKDRICVDLGHKSVAAENPLPRVHFLNAPQAKPISQSEEHLVLHMPQNHGFKVGDSLYGVPVHICPTVALYDTAQVVENGIVTAQWKVVARNRSISI